MQGRGSSVPSSQGILLLGPSLMAYAARVCRCVCYIVYMFVCVKMYLCCRERVHLYALIIRLINDAVSTV
jgi:hypothetical protein